MKPIIFNTEMVKAILEGRKIQTRRVLSQKVKDKISKDGDINIYDGKILQHCMGQGEPDGSGGIEIDHWDEDITSLFSKYKVDDILYVKETFQTCECGFCEICQVLDGIVFKADYNNKGEHPDLYSCHEDETYWKPSIHLKEKDARIFLKVINVRVERLQDISEDDLHKEGVVSYSEKWENMECKCTKNNRCQRYCDRRLDFINLWNSTSKDGYKWEDNPYIFVYEFERVEN